MAMKLLVVLLIAAAVFLLAWLVWLYMEDRRAGQEARQREREFAEAMRNLEREAGLDTAAEPGPVKDIQQPKPKRKPAKRLAVRAKRPKVIYKLDVAEPDRRTRKEGRGRT